MRTRIGKLSNTQRRGSILVLSALFMVVIFGFVAFSVDIGYIAVVSGQLQNAADSAAMSGAAALIENPGHARLKARDVAALNVAANTTVHVNVGADVEIGTWDKATATFTQAHPTDELRKRAVRVTCRRTADRGNSLQLFFAPVLGITQQDVEVTAIALLRRSRCGTIVGLESVDMVDGATDSYNSNLGSYASQTPGNEGHVCSNGPIQVGSGAIVNGDATPGKNNFTSIGSNGYVSGSIDSSKKTIDAPPINPGSAATNNDNSNIPSGFFDNSGNLKVQGQEVLTLPPGTYYIAGDLNTSAQAVIEVTGPTVIYIQETTSISGQGIVNVSENPANLKLFPLGDTAKFSGQAALHAVIYGPGSDITVAGNGGLFGEVLGKTLKTNGNTMIHADDALPVTKYSNNEVVLVE